MPRGRNKLLIPIEELFRVICCTSLCCNLLKDEVESLTHMRDLWTCKPVSLRSQWCLDYIWTLQRYCAISNNLIFCENNLIWGHSGP